MRLLRFFAANPDHCRSALPTLHAALPCHFRPARQLFILNFNLHALHFTRPGWTNAVQVKNYFRHAALDCCTKLRRLLRESARMSLTTRAHDSTPALRKIPSRKIRSLGKGFQSFMKHGGASLANLDQIEQAVMLWF